MASLATTSAPRWITSAAGPKRSWRRRCWFWSARRVALHIDQRRDDAHAQDHADADQRLDVRDVHELVERHLESDADEEDTERELEILELCHRAGEHEVQRA